MLTYFAIFFTFMTAFGVFMLGLEYGLNEAKKGRRTYETYFWSGIILIVLFGVGAGAAWYRLSTDFTRGEDPWHYCKFAHQCEPQGEPKGPWQLYYCNENPPKFIGD